jgi:hypothetical protein
MAAADGLLVLTSTDPAYTPSKLASCFLARKPVLCVTVPGSATARLAASLGLGMQLDIVKPASDALRSFVSDLTAPAPLWPGLRREQEFYPHTAEARTRELAAFFEHVLQARRIA